MGNVMKAVATGGLSLLPGKAGKVASAIGTGGASLLPGKAGRIAGGIMGDPTAIFGGGGYRKNPNPVNRPAPGGAVNPLGGPPIEKAMPGGGSLTPAGGAGAPLGQMAGIVSQLVGQGGGGMQPQAPQAPVQQETPRQRAARQAAQRAGRAQPADANARVVPPNQLNRPEVPNRGFVTNALRG